ncbi:YqgE/AlgH family protein [Allosphingosinicella vermicomposti]|uniref:YqgE/AlgH family protein n=1 Tax=Allosphingosinicella vermicomposti TaxID=614671 RepID=UPI000D0E6392|nr:YqgE/AlgH family protein [Allosphingosinicella vermicomposti]
MDGPIFLAGQFLLAMPGIGDPRFDKAVLAICAHDEDGALGIGLGRVMPRIRFHDLLGQLGIDPGDAPNAVIHQGGPVEPQRGFVLHSSDWGGEGTVDVAGRWRLTGTLDILKAIAAGKGPTRWVSALGYAGWSAGQLDEEMTRHGWFSVQGDEALMFDCGVDQRWDRGFASAGIDPRLLTSSFGTA